MLKLAESLTRALIGLWIPHHLMGGRGVALFRTPFYITS